MKMRILVQIMYSFFTEIAATETLDNILEDTMTEVLYYMEIDSFKKLEPIHPSHGLIKVIFQTLLNY